MVHTLLCKENAPTEATPKAEVAKTEPEEEETESEESVTDVACLDREIEFLDKVVTDQGRGRRSTGYSRGASARASTDTYKSSEYR